jgi:fructoselysine 6-kinase
VAVSQDLSVNAAPKDLDPDGLSIGFFSADGSREVAEASLRQMLEAGAALAVVTMGSRGSMASDGRNCASAQARSVRPVDTTGAGDTFIAAFIDAQMRGLDLKASLDAGGDAAANTCLHYGGFPQEAGHLSPSNSGGAT